MKRWFVWLTWLIAIAALWGAVSARMTHSSADASACESVIYWESPLLK